MRGFPPLRLALALAASCALCGIGRADLPPLNLQPTSDMLPGKFVWADLFTGNLTDAARFYTELFGWTASPVKLPASYRKADQQRRAYVVLYRESEPVAGIVQRPAGTTPHPARWVSYISVGDDLDGVLASVDGAGGRTLAPKREVPRRGAEAIVADNEGAVVGLIQSSTGDPLDRASAPGDWNWHELFVKNTANSAAFYRRVFHYSAEPDRRGRWPGHFILRSGGRPRAGISPLPDDPGSRSDWLGFVRVENIDAAVRKVARLGGTVEVAPGAPELQSRFAIISDPTGGTFGLVQIIPAAAESDQP
ncbi:MAG: VOC family protein [Opitutaceae bacterium]